MAPVELGPGFVCGHWSNETCLHQAQDVMFGEGANQTRKYSAPEALAALGSGVLYLGQAEGHTNIAGAVRQFAWQLRTALALLPLSPE
jgi:hypothetical protein